MKFLAEGGLQSSLMMMRRMFLIPPGIKTWKWDGKTARESCNPLTSDEIQDNIVHQNEGGKIWWRSFFSMKYRRGLQQKQRWGVLQFSSSQMQLHAVPYNVGGVTKKVGCCISMTLARKCEKNTILTNGASSCSKEVKKLAHPLARTGTLRNLRILPHIN